MPAQHFLLQFQNLSKKMENKDYTILIVDDEIDILDFLSYNLKKEGFIIHTAKNGLEAIQKTIEIVPHLILLDIMMPLMDGIEVCTEIKKIPEYLFSI